MTNLMIKTIVRTKSYHSKNTISLWFLGIYQQNKNDKFVSQIKEGIVIKLLFFTIFSFLHPCKWTFVYFRFWPILYVRLISESHLHYIVVSLIKFFPIKSLLAPKKCLQCKSWKIRYDPFNCLFENLQEQLLK